MTTLFGIGTDALTAFRRSLDTISNNIANVNTEGYSRQSVTFQARDPQFVGLGFAGRGVTISGIERNYNAFLTDQARTAGSSATRFATLASFAGRVDDLLADPDAGLGPALSQFYGAIQDFAADPASPSRDALFAEASNLIARFEALDARIGAIDTEADQAIAQNVVEINQLAESIADVNQSIVNAGISNAPNDLLDRRDNLIRELSERVDVTTVENPQGSVNVFIGKGQTLVVDSDNFRLEVQPAEFDPTRSQVVYVGLTGTTPVEDLLTGGSIGALLDFQSDILDPARRSLGASATAVSTAINAQNAQGLDASGALGGDVFRVAPPRVTSSSANASNATVSVSIEDLGAIRETEYRLLNDGADYRLFRVDTGEELALSGSGTSADPYRAGGLSIEVSGTPAAGDRFSIEPTKGALAGFELAISDGLAFAAAGPVRASAATANLSNAVIDNGTVTDITNPALLTQASIVFTSPTTYQIDGGADATFVPGDAINVNGVDFAITGTPTTGDRFDIAANTAAQGDNRNALLLGQTQSLGILRDGSLSISESYSQLVSRVGSATGQAQSSATAQSIILQSAQNRLQEASGVNLDEEAADLIRYQQSYQAAAQVISVASTLFDTLLAATRR
ncbi:MAG: flagellar hook-associated protein FlgK [Pseudomonadota bacterium]